MLQQRASPPPAEDRALVTDVLTQRWWSLDEKEAEVSCYDPKLHSRGLDVRHPTRQFEGLPQMMLNPLAPARFLALAVPSDSEELRMLRGVPERVEEYNRTYRFACALRVQNRALLQNTIGECARSTGNGYRFAFHGTHSGYLASIMAFGFVPHNVHTGSFGPGTYLARNCASALASYARPYRTPDGEEYAAVVVGACVFDELVPVNASSVYEEQTLDPRTQGAIAVHGNGSSVEEGEVFYVVQDYRRVYPAYVLLYSVTWKENEYL